MLDKWTRFLVRDILSLMKHGYPYVCFSEIPSEKSTDKKVAKICRKIENKYHGILTGRMEADKRYLRKKQGLVNLQLRVSPFTARGTRYLFLVRTEGPFVAEGDIFYDVRKADENKHVVIHVGERLSYRLGAVEAGRIDVYLSRGTLRWWRSILEDDIRHRRWQMLDEHAQAIRRLPGFAGIRRQLTELERRLKVFLKATAKPRSVSLPPLLPEPLRLKAIGPSLGQGAVE